MSMRSATTDRLQQLEAERATVMAQVALEDAAKLRDQAELEVQKRELEELDEFLEADRQRQKEDNAKFWSDMRHLEQTVDEALKIADEADRAQARREEAERVKQEHDSMTKQVAERVASIRMRLAWTPWTVSETERRFAEKHAVLVPSA